MSDHWNGKSSRAADSPSRATAAQVLRAVQRYWGFALLIVALCAGLGALFALRTPTATATASVLVQDPQAGNLLQAGATDATYVANQVAVLKLPTTGERAAQVLRQEGLTTLTGTDVTDKIAVDNTTGNDLITLSYTDASPTVAQAVVNAYLQAYTSGLAETAAANRTALLARLDAALVALRKDIAGTSSPTSKAGLEGTYANLLQRKAEALALDPGSGSGVTTVSTAALPPRPHHSSPFTTLLLGAFLGLIPAAAVSLLLAHARRRFGDRFEPEELVGVPLLTDIPDFRLERLTSDVPVIDAPSSASTEAFRFGTTLLAVRAREQGSRVHAVVSSASQDGKSTVTANLSVTSAQNRNRVLAVDGDLGGRGLSFLLLDGRTEGPGLVDVLEGRISLEAAVVQVALPGGVVLDVLRGGTASADASQLMASSRSRELLQMLRGDYDEVFIDVPPVLQVAYAASLVRAADAVVVVVPHHALVGRIENLMERLTVLEVAVLGYLYNAAPLRRELGMQSRLVTDLRRRPHLETVPPRSFAPAPPGRRLAP